MHLESGVDALDSAEVSGVCRETGQLQGCVSPGPVDTLQYKYRPDAVASTRVSRPIPAYSARLDNATPLSPVRHPNRADDSGATASVCIVES